MSLGSSEADWFALLAVVWDGTGLVPLYSSYGQNLGNLGGNAAPEPNRGQKRSINPNLKGRRAAEGWQASTRRNLGKSYRISYSGMKQIMS